jgi:hypothetical protein
MKNRIKPCGGRYDAPYTLKEVGELVGCSWQHVQNLEVSALTKLKAGLKEKMVANSDFVQGFRDGLMTSKDYEDAILLTVAEELGLPTPTSRLESFEDSLRALFEAAYGAKN